jgi:hypothetical protein
MARENREAQEAEEEKRRQNESAITGLAGYVQKCWQAARDAKVIIEQRMLNCLRQRKGIYTPDKLEQIRNQGGSEIWIMLTSVKCRAAEAWIRDVILPSGEKPWHIEPTPIPHLPPDVDVHIKQMAVEQAVKAVQMGALDPDEAQKALGSATEEMRDRTLKFMRDKAREYCERMDAEIESRLVEGKFYPVLDQIVSDFVTFPTAFLKGPVIRRRKSLVWDQPFGGQQNVPRVVEELKTEYDRVSPFDIYPSPSARTLNDGDGYVCQRHRLTRAQLQLLIGVDGYSESEIRAVLEQYGNTYSSEWLGIDQDRAELENRYYEQQDPQGTIDAIEFTGAVRGQLLLVWGMSAEDIPDSEKDYEVNLWQIGPHTIRAVLSPHPLGDRGYYYDSFERVAESIWGNALPELFSDIQDICNASARAMVNNMAISSGPQVDVNVDRIPAGEELETMAPWRIWQTTSSLSGVNEPAIRFFQPNAMTAELLKLFDYFYNLTSEVTGIPSYSYGADAGGGPSKTASGLSMLMNSAARVMKRVVGNFDQGVIVPAIEGIYTWLMMYADDPMIKGDVNIRARASDYLIMMEALQARRNEFLTIATNPTIAQILGPNGLAEILRENVKALKYPDVDEIVPSRKDILMNKIGELEGALQKISAVTNIPIEQLNQIAAANPGANGNGAPAPGEIPGQTPGPKNLNEAGEPNIAGRETREFHGGK